MSIERIFLACVFVVGAACSDSNSASPDSSVAPGDARAGDTSPVGTVVPTTWIDVAAGTFTMGSPAAENCRDADEVAHQVTLTRAFRLDEKEVTRGAFRSLMGYDPSFAEGCGDDCPVESVTWHEAAAYCNALSSAKGLQQCYACSGSGESTSCSPSASPFADCEGYRLPTEAEWEYAARAGTTGAFYNGGITSCMTTDGNAGRIAWYKVNSSGGPHTVKSKDANPWGLYDLSGNVYEWTNDWYQQDLGSAASTDPVGPQSGSERVMRGGAWYYNAHHARSANRERFKPAKRFTFVGFRCAQTQLGGK